MTLTLEETGKIMACIKMYYPQAFKDYAPQEKKALLKKWQEQFAEDDYSVVGAAIDAFAATDEKGFAPMVGQIKAIIRKLTKPEEMSEQEAVNLVIKAASRSIYNSQEEFDKLPPVLQRLVGKPSKLREWAMMDTDTVNSVVASNLMRSYKVIAEREREYQALPSQVKALIDGVKKNFMLEEGK